MTDDEFGSGLDDDDKETRAEPDASREGSELIQLARSIKATLKRLHDDIDAIERRADAQAPESLKESLDIAGEAFDDRQEAVRLFRLNEELRKAAAILK